MAVARRDSKLRISFEPKVGMGSKTNFEPKMRNFKLAIGSFQKEFVSNSGYRMDLPITKHIAAIDRGGVG